MARSVTRRAAPGCRTRPAVTPPESGTPPWAMRPHVSSLCARKVMAAPQSHVVKSARRVLEVLEYFDAENPSATVGDISKKLHYPQSSTSILLRCLRDLGFLYYNRTTRKYRPTSRSALLGCWAEGGAYRGGRMLDLLDAVAKRVGETVVL